MKNNLLRLIVLLTKQTLKFFLLQLLVIQVLVAGPLASQGMEDYQVQLQVKNQKLVQVLADLEKQTDFIFAYNHEVAKDRARITLNLSSDLKSVLKKITEQVDYDFKRVNDQIYVVKSELAFLSKKKKEPIEENINWLDIEITGKVTDQNGEPIPGVTVSIPGTSVGTVTDLNGFYSLKVPEGANVVFSFIGYLTQRVSVGNQNEINVTLKEDISNLEEVVVVGYGTQKKANLTGAVGTATSERLENRPITSAGRGLQGVIPNLNIDIRNGDPSTPAQYNIRGFESITGGNPLILVDNVPMDLEMINPMDIESVSVLKDAAASAIYGARAAFGVILIETKKGTGEPKFTFNSEYSMSKFINNLDPVTDPYVNVTEFNKASLRSLGRAFYDDNLVEGTRRWSENPTEENTWGVHNGVLQFYGHNNYLQEAVRKFAPQQTYNATMSGSTEKATYYVSFGVLDKDGFWKVKGNENYRRYNILMKADFEVNDWISFDEKIVFNYENSNKPHIYNATNASLGSVARKPSAWPIRFPDLPYYVEPGDRETYEQYIGMGFSHLNAIPYVEEGGRTINTVKDLWFTQGVTLNPFEGLKVIGKFSTNFYSRNFEDAASNVTVVFQDDAVTNLLSPNLLTFGYSANDYVENQNDDNQYYVLNTHAEYTLEKFEDHYLRAMVGFNQEWGQNSFFRARSDDLISPQIPNLNATTGTDRNFGNKSHVAIRGAFYRLNYIYNDKYLLELNGRYDGSSRFPKESRFGFFPSLSAGWRISEESFMGATEGWLDDLKIRASYGELGNQLLGNNYYPYISSLGTGNAQLVMDPGQVTPYVSAANLVGAGLTWERVITKNMGIDLVLLDGKLEVSTDYYTRDTKDMLMNINYPTILGAEAPDQNAADLQTKGWELSVLWRDNIGQDWQYGINLALSDNQSEITKFFNPTGAISNYYEGQKIGEIWGYETLGIFQTEEEVTNHADQLNLGSNWLPGDIKYADLNNDGRLDPGDNTIENPGDRKIIGNSSPRYSFGINPRVSYKNWSFDIFFQGLFRDYYPEQNAFRTFWPFNSEYLENYFITESWSEDNRDAYFAAPHLSRYTRKNITPQTRFLQNAAYIRLKNLTLNYNLPQGFIDNVGLSRAQVYFSGMNLWEFSKIHQSLDPESVHTTRPEYFQQRIFTLGVRATF